MKPDDTYLRRVEEKIVKDKIKGLAHDQVLSSAPDVFRRAFEEDAWPEALSIGSWKFFNEAVGGLRKGEFSILSGPSGYGKTTFLANIAAQLYAQNTKIFVASVEVGDKEFAKKMVSALGNIPIQDGARAAGAAFLEGPGEIFTRNFDSVFTNYESRVDHRRLIADLWYAYDHNQIEVAFIDNFNYIYQPSGKQNEIVEMDRVIHEWVQVVKHLPIHIFMVCHPKKTDNKRVDSMYDIKGSSTAIQEAQNVFLFNRLDEDSLSKVMTGTPDEQRFFREVKVEKCRFNGKQTGKKIIYRQDDRTERYEEVNKI